MLSDTISDDDVIDLDDAGLLQSPTNVNASNFDLSTELSLQALSLKDMIDSSPPTPKAKARKSRESLAFFNTISASKDVEALEEITFDEVDNFVEFPDIINIGSPVNLEKEDDLKDLRLQDTDFSDRPKATFNPFEEQENKKESEIEIVSSTPSSAREKEDDLVVFFGTPKENELNIMRELQNVPTVKALKTKDCLSVVGVVSNPKSPCSLKPPLITSKKSALLSPPKVSSCVVDQMLNQLKTPPKQSRNDKIKSVETPELIRNVRKKMESINKTNSIKNLTVEGGNGNVGSMSILTSPDVQSWLNKRKKNVSVESSPKMAQPPLKISKISKIEISSKKSPGTSSIHRSSIITTTASPSSKQRPLSFKSSKLLSPSSSISNNKASSSSGNNSKISKIASKPLQEEGEKRFLENISSYKIEPTDRPSKLPKKPLVN